MAGIIAVPPAQAFNLTAPAVAQRSDVVEIAVQNKQVSAAYRRKKVRLVTDEKAGTIIIDTNNKYLYYVEGNNRATRYGVGVGRDGFGWSGIVKIGRKAEWPDWVPPKEMIAREARKGRKIPAFQEGGVDNPLGARAMYLYQGGRDTIFRIHGTNQPWTIGQNMSSGCIRMMNKDVEHLYDRAGVGTKVIVVGPGNRQGKVAFEDRGIDVLRTMFGG
ncbi:L,D-transpeptidase [Metarhizobium album]|uniref:L,D-transpeptidase n=2 Tax=Metarhizobium album TaxID=2182425 RepID=A0A2U2DYK8_9HYPH|nr:L,D-transpeptidase [Rhizobium album]